MYPHVTWKSVISTCSPQFPHSSPPGDIIWPWSTVCERSVNMLHGGLWNCDTLAENEVEGPSWIFMLNSSTVLVWCYSPNLILWFSTKTSKLMLPHVSITVTCGFFIFLQHKDSFRHGGSFLPCDFEDSGVLNRSFSRKIHHPWIPQYHRVATSSFGPLYETDLRLWQF